jgi:DNA-binding sugar fermentation-stimulating protein
LLTAMEAGVEILCYKARINHKEMVLERAIPLVLQ